MRHPKLNESNGNTTNSEINHPYYSANPVSRYFFWWLLGILRTGLRRQIVPGDIYNVPPNLQSAHVSTTFGQCWEHGKSDKSIPPLDNPPIEGSYGISTERQQNKSPAPWRLLRTIIRVHGTGVTTFGFLYSSLESACRIGQPFLLGQLILYFDQQRSGRTADNTTTSLGAAYGYASGIVMTVLAPLAIFHSYQLFLLKVGMKIRIGCCALIFRKILRLGIATEGLSGTVINLMANDVSRFDYAVIFFHDLWKGPVELVIVALFVYFEIGGSGLIGIGILLLFIPVQAWLGKRSARFRLATALATDERVRFTNEIIRGIQVIKMYAWEAPFERIVHQLRRKEIKALRGSALIKSVLYALRVVPKMSIFFSLIAYVYFDNALTARRVYMLISFFSVIQRSMVEFWPLAVTSVAEAWISLKRIQEFLLQDEIAEEQHIPEEKEETREKLSVNLDDVSQLLDPSIEFINVQSSWAGSSFSLQRVSFAVSAYTRRTTAVVGSIGAGKSSLLNLIIGEQCATDGKMLVNGTVSYCSQKPWLFEGTIRENVLFIEPFDEERYRRVLRVCALEQDIRLWARGDQTMVGERGVSLSGGQKTRINLARALYRQADIYLLDDPLSAVDVHVANVIFEEGIQTFLAGKLCILVTHQLNILREVQHILMMEDGKIVAQGSYAELIEHFKSAQCNEQVMSEDLSGNMHEHGTGNLTEDQHSVGEKESKETQEDGTIKYQTYLEFFKYVRSTSFALLVILLMVASQVATTGTDYFVSIWVDWEETYANTAYARWTTDDHVGFYTGAMIITIVMTLNSFAFFEMCLKASLHIHSALYRGVSETSMLFFNANASGRIMNRFSKDVGLMDSSLPVVMIDSVYFFLELLGIIVIVSLANYWLLVPTAIMGCVFYLLRFVFLRTARNVKRVEAITRSPVFTHTNTTIEGLSTIRSFGAETYMEDAFHRLQDGNTSAAFLFGATTRGFAFWLDFICLLYIASVVLSFLVIGSGIISGNVGLAITQVLNLVGMCNWGIRQTAELENQMTSVERVLEYTRLEPEQDSAVGAPVIVTGDIWPENPSITFREVSLHYTPTTNPVLKRLSFDIKAKERVGIVGRTGAGKSSIIQALFRLIPTSNGVLIGRDGIIEIDRINIDSVPLRQYRSRVSIIPQDPVIFSGSLRNNLDPYGQLPDEQLWKSLEQVELLNTVTAMAGGLSTKMIEGGTNFSAGQRQLLCLARAMLKNTNILIMDEATASVDPKTDELIQRTIREHFRHCTILTIAHRLHTIMDYDRILVMDAGQVVEFDSPERLLLIPRGFLQQLVENNNNMKRRLFK